MADKQKLFIPTIKHGGGGPMMWAWSAVPKCMKVIMCLFIKKKKPVKIDIVKAANTKQTVWTNHKEIQDASMIWGEQP